MPDRLNKSGPVLSQSEGQMLIDVMNDHGLEHWCNSQLGRKRNSVFRWTWTDAMKKTLKKRSLLHIFIPVFPEFIIGQDQLTSFCYWSFHTFPAIHYICGRGKVFDH